jgi:copper chaperone CopZ
MKHLKTVSIVSVLFFAFSFASYAQGLKYVKIKTSAQTEMCKTNIEKSLKSQAGVKEANLDLESKVVTVGYSEAKTDYEKITKAITDLGYSADDKEACKDAYSKLPKDCKSECSGKTKTTVKETSGGGC